MRDAINGDSLAHKDNRHRDERSGGGPKKDNRQKEERSGSGSGSSSSRQTIFRDSWCTSLGPHDNGLWAAELNPYKALVVRIPEGFQLSLLRASLRNSEAAESASNNVPCAVRCRTPAKKLPSTLCFLQAQSDETCALSACFTSRDGSCALAVEGSCVVHVLGRYTQSSASEASLESQPSTSSSTHPSQAPKPPAGAMEAAAAPSTAPALVKLEHGVSYADTKVGHGKAAASGDKLSIKYTGVAPSSGGGWKVFDSNDGKAVHFTLGDGEVIRGWEIGLVGMRTGGVRRLVVPPAMGYGERGSGPVPPRATLIFDIRLLNAV